MAEVVMIPQGKGKPMIAVADADDDLLEKFIAWVESGEASPRWAGPAEAARVELEGRRAPLEESAALERVPPALPMTHDPAAINARFDEYRKAYILAAPATHVDALPAGFGVSVAFVPVNPTVGPDGPGDVYKVGSKVALAGHIIQQIAAASAVDWDPVLSRRLDDASDPDYCHFLAVGWIKNFDGTPRQIAGNVEIDAREGSRLIDSIRAKAEKRKIERPREYNDGGDAEIFGIRNFILRSAETKARNRATMTALGLKRAYHAAELAKPFAVARLSFTGHHEDPALREKFGMMLAQAALQGSRQLYGGASSPPQLPPAPASSGHAPPPLDTVPDADFDDEFDGDDFEPSDGAAPPAASPPPKPAPAKQQRPKASKPAAAPVAGSDPFSKPPEAKAEPAPAAAKPEPPPNPDDDGR